MLTAHAMLIIAMLGGSTVDIRSEFDSIKECMQLRELVLRQDEASIAYCVPLGKSGGVETFQIMMDRFMLFIQELSDMNPRYDYNKCGASPTYNMYDDTPWLHDRLNPSRPFTKK